MERYQPQPPKETHMFRAVPMQKIADLLKTLPVPITITQHLIEGQETFFFRYQVGQTTPDNPVGICMGSTPHFLEAVKFSLQAVMGRQQEEAEGQKTRRAQSRQRTQERADEWIVPEVERGECSDTQAAALGLPYRHRITGETIAQWTERTAHDQTDATSQVGEMGEQSEREFIHLLRNLPVALNVWKREDGYVWQCFEQSGIAEDFATGVREGLHALLGQLMQDQERRQGTFRTFGDTLYQTDDGYTERVIADTARGRVVTVENQGTIRLFRVEWTEQDGYQAHKAVYTLRDAMDAFQAVVHPEQQGEV